MSGQKYLNYLELIWFNKRILTKFLKITLNTSRVQKYRSDTNVTKFKLYSSWEIEQKVKCDNAS